MTMDPEMLRARWQSGEALQVGHSIFDAVAEQSRPAWAARVLRVALSQAPEHAADVAAVLAVADDPRRWAEGHAVFSSVRREVLKLDERGRTAGWTPATLTRAHLLAIAELVAKVTYNATSPRDEFDEDSGWWVAVCLRNLVEHVRDASFERDAWRALLPTP